MTPIRQDYRYDGNGKLIAIRYNGNEYYYVTNIQGDVIGLIDATGATVVEYSYDAWGNIIATTGTLATSLGQANPFRYRGYYFDSETGLYYLQSRYYDPMAGRFINADDTGILQLTQGVLFVANIYFYCQNSPISNSDPSGYIDFNAIKQGFDFMKEVLKKFPGFIRNIQPFSTDFGNRIPDFINKFVIGEIKNVRYLSLTKQIKGFIQIARQYGKTFILVVRIGTKLSKPLVKEISAIGGKIIEIGSNELLVVFSIIPWGIIEELMKCNPAQQQRKSFEFH